MTLHKHVDFEVPAWGEVAHGPALWHAYAEAMLALGPVAWWRLGETGGTAAVDAAGGHGGAYVGGVTLGGPGALSRDSDPAAAFDGATGRVIVPHHASLDVGGSVPATWLAWVRKDALNDDRRWFLGKGRPSAGSLMYLLEINAGAGRVGVGIHNGSWNSVQSDAGLDFSGWRMVVVTWDGVSEFRFYHDGQPAGQAVSSPTSFPASSGGVDLQIGAAYASGGNNNLYYFDGALDEVAIFGRVLTAVQIADLHRRGRGIFQLPA